MAETIALVIFYFLVAVLITVIVILILHNKKAKRAREVENTKITENVAEEDNDQSQNPLG